MYLSRLLIPATKLFAGLNNEFYTFSHQFQELAGAVIRYEDFYRNSITQLAAVLSPVAFDQLVREGGFRTISSLVAEYAYSGTDDFILTYYQTGPWLVIFASGEFQPARYKIYLEGVWRVVP